MTTDSSDWTVQGNMSIHRSGARLVFEGHPDSDDFQIVPEQFPRALSGPETASLFREGVEAYRRSFNDRASHEATPATSSPQEARNVTITVKRRRSVVVPPSGRQTG